MFSVWVACGADTRRNWTCSVVVRCAALQSSEHAGAVLLSRSRQSPAQVSGASVLFTPNLFQRGGYIKRAALDAE